MKSSLSGIQLQRNDIDKERKEFAELF